MIACRLRTFAKCQRPKSGDNTEEGWRGMEREPFCIRIHPHPHVHAYRAQNKPQDVRHSSRRFITGLLDPHFSLKPYILHALCALAIFNLAVFVCLLFSWLRRFCLYLSTSHQANSPDLAHVHLAICKQSMIGCGLISRYWIFWRTNTLLLTKGQKHHKGLRDSVCISAKGLYLQCWLNKTLTWMILFAPFISFDRKKKNISSL